MTITCHDDLFNILVAIAVDIMINLLHASALLLRGAVYQVIGYAVNYNVDLDKIAWNYPCL